MITLENACNILHIDQGTNDELITGLIEAIPDYIEVTTGMTFNDQINEPLCDTVGGFLLTLWFYSDHTDDQALNRTIASLLKVITLKARSLS